MSTLKNIILCIVFMVMSQQFAFAQANLPANDATTAALVDLCKNQQDQDAQNFCFGFGEGVYQSYIADRSPNAKPNICFSQQSATRAMILQEFLKWTQANPQFNQERAAKTLIRFFVQSYPCK